MPIFSIWILFEDRTEQQYRTGTTVLIDDLVGLHLQPFFLFLYSLTLHQWFLRFSNALTAVSLGPFIFVIPFFSRCTTVLHGKRIFAFLFSSKSIVKSTKQGNISWALKFPTSDSNRGYHRLFQFSIFPKQNWKWNLIQIPLECLSRS